MATNDIRNLVHLDSEEFGVNISAQEDADEQLGLQVTVDSRNGYIVSLDADGESAHRIGTIAHTFRRDADTSDGTYTAAVAMLALLTALDPGWVSENGITVEWLAGS